MDTDGTERTETPTTPTVDKGVVKEAMKDLFKEMPALRKFFAEEQAGEASTSTAPGTTPPASGTVSPASGGLGGAVDPASVESLGLPSFEGTTEPTAKTLTPTTGEKQSSEPQSAGQSEERSETGPFVLSEALPVIPAKLVKRILKCDFIDMSELLKDNMEAERRRKLEGDVAHSHFLQRASRREIPDMLSWLHCFSLYAAVVTSRHPEKIKELLAYQAIMIGEARRCGGRGWLLYDSAFHQQIAAFDAVDFSKINQSLYATTFLAFGGRGQFCQSCMLPDHAHEDCALHPNRVVPMVRMSEAGKSSASRPREVSKAKQFETPRKRARRRACYAWNDGTCPLSEDTCSFEHVCSRCFGNHRKEACRPQGPGAEGGMGPDPTRPLPTR